MLFAGAKEEAPSGACGRAQGVRPSLARGLRLYRMCCVLQSSAFQYILYFSSEFMARGVSYQCRACLGVDGRPAGGTGDARMVPMRQILCPCHFFFAGHAYSIRLLGLA